MVLFEMFIIACCVFKCMWQCCYVRPFQTYCNSEVYKLHTTFKNSKNNHRKRGQFVNCVIYLQYTLQLL